MDDGHHMKPAEVFSYLTRVIYNRRNKCEGPTGGVGAGCACPALGLGALQGTDQGGVRHRMWMTQAAAALSPLGAQEGLAHGLGEHDAWQVMC